MKKLLCVLAVLVFCFGMAAPAMAADGEFVPSIPYKDHPLVIHAEIDDDVVTDCIVVTSVKEARDKVTDISQEERDLLLEVYEALNDGSMTLPLDEDYVIRELLDVNFKLEACRNQESHNNKDKKLDEDGTTISITFDLGIGAYVDLKVLSYHDGEWSPITSVTNNGDGTVTCVFEHFCPVAFVVNADQYVDNPKTGDAMGQDLMLWGGLFTMSLVALTVAVFLYSRNRKRS